RSERHMMTSACATLKEQVSHYREHGWLMIPGSLGKAAVQPVRTHVLDELKRQNFWSGGRSLSGRLKGVPMFQQIGNLGQAIRHPGLHDRLMPHELHALICRLAGAPLPHAVEAQLLISLPHQT